MVRSLAVDPGIVDLESPGVPTVLSLENCIFNVARVTHRYGLG